MCQQSYNVLVLCHDGPMPIWCRTKLKIAAKQQLEHIAPCDLSFLSLNQGRLKERGQIKVLSLPLLTSCLFFQLLSSNYSLPYSISSLCPRKEKERRAIKGEGRRRKNELSGLGSETLPSPVLKSHFIITTKQPMMTSVLGSMVM